MPRGVVGFARLIHRRVRAFWPAFGGSLSLTWLLLSVVKYSHRHCRVGVRVV